jgi:hypothetical protein
MNAFHDFIELKSIIWYTISKIPSLYQAFGNAKIGKESLYLLRAITRVF